jgi:hypothetical protein
LGIFGRSGRELGTVAIQASWLEKNPTSREAEFILVCEGRDERVQDGRIDEEAIATLTYSHWLLLLHCLVSSS